MHDNTLVAIALTTSAIGITLLLFALIIMDVRVQTVDGARATADGTPITVEGTVERVTHRGNLTIITISQPTSMDATVFEDLDTTTLTQGTCVRIVGKKDSYKGTAQLVASEVAVCEEGEHVRSG